MKYLKQFLAAAALLAVMALAVPSIAQIVSGPPGPNFKNVLDNPRFDIYQRGTTAVTGVNTTATYHADRWAAYASAAGASVSLTNITANLPAGFTNAEKVQRAAANANLLPVCLIQEIPTSTIKQVAGTNVTLSEWLLAGGNLSSTGSVVSAQLVTGTGTDEGIAKVFNGVNWTGQAVTSFSQAATTSWQRYSWATSIPAAATEAAVQFCFTPVGTAGTDDSFQVTGVQLEQGTFSSVFEDRPLAYETQRVQSTYFRFAELAAAYQLPAICQATGANTNSCTLNLPTPMKSIPTITITTAGTFKVNIAGVLTTIATPTAGACGLSTCLVTAANTNTAGQAELLSGAAGGTGVWEVSADF
jgi:hypothetical protein